MKNQNSLSRRTFLKTGMVLTAGIPVMRAFPLYGSTAVADSALYEAFKNPPVTAQPFVRWWWNGDKLSAKEILRELDILKAAGIGGVEINPIAFPGGDDLTIPSMTWLSQDWIDMVKVALKGAAERDMVCDIIVGSGWPFGAEFLSREEQTQLLTLTGMKVKGPGKRTVALKDVLNNASPKVNKYKDALEELYALYLAPTTMDKFEEPKKIPIKTSDIEKTVKTTDDKGVTTESKVVETLLNIDVPAGEHILYALVKVTGFQAVINGAPGAAGPVLNHYNQQAVEKFLNRMSDKLFPQLTGLKPFRAMFCDSMELEGANWCYDFPEEFKRRRGYDVLPYLPFFLTRVGGMGTPIDSGDVTLLSGDAKEEVQRVRYDFVITCMEVMRDRFLIPYTQWCNRNGFLSRVQTYGREFHPLEASMNIDIPECETWLWNNDGDARADFADNPPYTNVNKFVASAARLSGKKIVSCEESTNTGAVFNATLERLKITCDMSNLSGVTHSILHGFNYTPLEAPFPGWIRYGMFLNERNLWWRFFPQWAAYKSRVSVLLQQSTPFADIAVMHPLADMWTNYGTVRDPFPEKFFPPYQYKVWEAIHKNGNSCDYTSEAIIQQSEVQNGCLCYGTRRYNTLILLEVETMMPATAKMLASFAAKGGKIIFVAKEPCKAPGLQDHKANDRTVAKTIADMKKASPRQVYNVEAPQGDILTWFANIQKTCGIRPYMKIDHPDIHISQIRHKADGKDIFFVSNCSTNYAFTLLASFPDSKGTPCLWDAQTGERYKYPYADNSTLSIELQPATSQIIVFDTNETPAEYPELPAEHAPALEVKKWNLKLEHINGTDSERNIDTLFDLSDFPDTRAFAGRLIYTAKVEGDTSAYNWIDLGKVYGVSEVEINGKPLGNRWYGQHRYRIPTHLATGSKTIVISVTTTLGNYFKSDAGNKTGHGWTAHQPWQPVGIMGPVRLC